MGFPVLFLGDKSEPLSSRRCVPPTLRGAKKPSESVRPSNTFGRGPVTQHYTVHRLYWATCTSDKSHDLEIIQYLDYFRILCRFCTGRFELGLNLSQLSFFFFFYDAKKQRPVRHRVAGLFPKLHIEVKVFYFSTTILSL